VNTYAIMYDLKASINIWHSSSTFNVVTKVAVLQEITAVSTISSYFTIFRKN